MADNTKKKRVYDEKDIEAIHFPSTSRSRSKKENIANNTLNNPVSAAETGHDVKPKADTTEKSFQSLKEVNDARGLNGVEKKNGVFAKTENAFNKTSRIFDRLTDSNYKEYKVNSLGKSNLSQFTDKELKFLNRDLKIAGKDNISVKAAIAEHKIDIKAYKNSAKVNTLYTVKTDKGTINIGADRKSGKLMIASSDYKNNPNVKNWSTLNKGELARTLENKGHISSIRITDESSLTRQNLGTPKSREEVQKTISGAIENSSAKNAKITYNQNAPIQEKKTEKSQTVAQDRAASLERNTSEKNEVARETHTTTEKSAPQERSDLAAKKEEQKASSKQDVAFKGILNDNTVFGHSKDDAKQVYVGTVNKNNTVNWQTKEDYLQTLGPKSREMAEKQLSTSNDTYTNVTAVGKVNDNTLYVAKDSNNETVITANQKDWLKADGLVGSQLLSMAGIDIAALSVLASGDMSRAASSESIEHNSRPVFEQNDNSQSQSYSRNI